MCTEALSSPLLVLSSAYAATAKGKKLRNASAALFFKGPKDGRNKLQAVCCVTHM